MQNERFAAFAARSSRVVLCVVIIAPCFVFECPASAGQIQGSGLKRHGVASIKLNGGGQSFAIALQDDGKIVTAGQSNDEGFALIRYNSDRTLDSTFGSAGRIVKELGLNSFAVAVAIQPDGKIIAAGGVQTAIPPPAPDKSFGMVVARYRLDGMPDPGFGNNGYVILNPGSLDIATCLALQPDGKIIVGGVDIWAPDIVDYGNGFAVARLNPDGTLDTTFGTDGSVITRFNLNADLWSLKLQADGKVVAAGYTNTWQFVHFFALVRYDQNGSLDPTFGDGGIAVTTPVQDGRLASVEVQPDGRLVVTGSVGGKIAVARYNPDGSLDPSFAGGGVQLSLDGEGRSVALQSNGSIVIGGSVFSENEHDFAILRFNADGAPDTSFGSDGVLGVSLGHFAEGQAIAIGRHGRMLLAGYLQKNSQDATYKFALVEYRP